MQNDRTDNGPAGRKFNIPLRAENENASGEEHDARGDDEAEGEANLLLDVRDTSKNG